MGTSKSGVRNTIRRTRLPRMDRICVSAGERSLEESGPPRFPEPIPAAKMPQKGDPCEMICVVRSNPLRSPTDQERFEVPPLRRTMKKSTDF